VRRRPVLCGWTGRPPSGGGSAAAPGEDRFRLDFRIDVAKRLTVSAFDLRRMIWVLDRQPPVRLA
jgi:hypothetical protein